MSGRLQPVRMHVQVLAGFVPPGWRSPRFRVSASLEHELARGRGPPPGVRAACRSEHVGISSHRFADENALASHFVRCCLKSRSSQEGAPIEWMRPKILNHDSPQLAAVFARAHATRAHVDRLFGELFDERPRDSNRERDPHTMMRRPHAHKACVGCHDDIAAAAQFEPAAEHFVLIVAQEPDFTHAPYPASSNSTIISCGSGAIHTPLP
jgi:hypothetical protein